MPPPFKVLTRPVRLINIKAHLFIMVFYRTKVQKSYIQSILSVIIFEDALLLSIINEDVLYVFNYFKG